MTPLGTAVYIAVQRLRLLLRSRSGSLAVFVLPLLVITVTGLIVAGQARPPVGWVDDDRSAMSARMLAKLDGTHVMQLRPYHDDRSLETAVREGLVVAGVEIPRGYGTSLVGGGTAAVRFLTIQGAASLPSVKTALDSAAALAGSTVEAGRFASRMTHAPFDTTLRDAEELDAQAPAITVHVAALGSSAPRPGGFEYTAPANLILFVFINSLGAAAGLIMTRQTGVATRMSAAPVRPLAVLAGEGLGRVLIAVFQGAIIMVVGALVFRVQWGDPLAAVALMLCFALLSAGAAMLLSVALRTPEAAIAIGPPVGIALGMLGGCMWPLDIVGPAMRAIGHVFPHAWAVDGLLTVAAGGHLGDIAGDLGVLLVMTAAILAAGMVAMRRSLRLA